MKRIAFALMAAGLIGWSAFTSNLYAAEKIFSDGFENGLDQWDVMDPSAHQQSSAYAHGGYYSHKVDGVGAQGEVASIEFESPADNRIYLSFWWLLAGAPDTGGRLGSFTVPGTGARMEIWWTRGSHAIAVRHYDTSASLPQCANGTSRVHATNTTVFDNQWHHFEMFIEYNTPGIDDGRLRVWIDRPAGASYADGRYLKVDHDDVRFINEGICEVYYASLSLPPQLDDGMQPGSLFYDDVALWDDLPPGERSAAPAAPTGLRVVR